MILKDHKYFESGNSYANMSSRSFSYQEMYLRAADFTFETAGMERLDKKEPCMILMNHSSFIDLEIAARLLADREYHIVCTRDGFVGKDRAEGICSDVSGGKLQL